MRTVPLHSPLWPCPFLALVYTQLAGPHLWLNAVLCLLCASIHATKSGQGKAHCHVELSCLRFMISIQVGRQCLLHHPVSPGFPSFSWTAARCLLSEASRTSLPGRHQPQRIDSALCWDNWAPGSGCAFSPGARMRRHRWALPHLFPFPTCNIWPHSHPVLILS